MQLCLLNVLLHAPLRASSLSDQASLTRRSSDSYNQCDDRDRPIDRSELATTIARFSFQLPLQATFHSDDPHHVFFACFSVHT